MRVAQLFSIFSSLRLGDRPTDEVSSLVFDSRNVKKNSVFVAIRGEKSDGHAHLAQAVSGGAVGLVVEDSSAVPSEFKGAVAVVEDSRKALNQLASRFYSHPSQKLFVVGITGTNGKTTTTNMVEKVLAEYGWPCGVIGTIDHHFQNHVWPTELTTPDPVAFQKRLSEFVALGARAVCLEVSSHALVQSRVDEVEFDVAIFTNLTRDHLDYHKDMENYFLAKAKLFTELLPKSPKKNKYAIINIDDEYGRRLSAMTSESIISYTTKKADVPHSQKVAATFWDMDFASTRFEVETRSGGATFEIKMTGLHNVYNACAAIGVGLAAGANLETCAKGLARLESVNGRLQFVPNPKGLQIFVDYAHTHDALQNSLSHLKQIRSAKSPQAKLFCVFGCGGDRDAGKRPLMLKAAQEFSDAVIVTSDNPRTEDPEKIISDIVGTQKMSEKLMIEVDRKKAIVKSLDLAKTGDIILIAGKGHEDYQIIGTKKFEFSDFKVVKEYFA